MSRYDFDVNGFPEPPDDSKQFFAAVAIAAVLVVLVAWLWIGQDDINRLRREAGRVNAAPAAEGVK